MATEHSMDIKSLKFDRTIDTCHGNVLNVQCYVSSYLLLLNIDGQAGCQNWFSTIISYINLLRGNLNSFKQINFKSLFPGHITFENRVTFTNRIGFVNKDETRLAPEVFSCAFVYSSAQ